MNTKKMSNEAKNPALNKGAVMCSNFVDELQNDYGASDYDMMMIFGTDARTQAEYLRDNPQFQGIVELMDCHVTSRLRGRF